MLRRISLDTRFRGYDGTRDGFVLIPAQVFSKEVNARRKRKRYSENLAQGTERAQRNRKKSISNFATWARDISIDPPLVLFAANSLAVTLMVSCRRER